MVLQSASEATQRIGDQRCYGDISARYLPQIFSIGDTVLFIFIAMHFSLLISLSSCHYGFLVVFFFFLNRSSLRNFYLSNELFECDNKTDINLY